MRQIMIQTLLGAAALAATACWTNQLLFIGKKSVETVFQADEFEQLAEAPPTNPPAPETAEPTPQPALQQPETLTAAKPPQPTEQSAAPAPAASTPQPAADQLPAAPAAPIPPPTTGQPAAIAAAVTGQGPPPHPEPPESGTAAAIVPGSAAVEGGLVSFSGTGIAGGPSFATLPGSQIGLVYDIQFASRPDWKLLSRIPGIFPTAIRCRPGFVEIAPLQNGTVAQPLALNTFLASHPDYAGRWAVLLPRELLVDVSEQLLPFGGGWQPHLLIGDRRFSQWMNEAQAFVVQRGQTLQNIARLEALAQLHYRDGQYDIRLMFQGLEIKEPPL